ncbi:MULTISPECIES: urease accessory protein UreE [Rhodomicrobium]|uniref:urease accessory protein UreE n=1 Tax=Rhodomicrobium TaxID=1068 RepID=UPI000B4B022F|nr:MULTISPECIES: urease accessory protein UreE [Rhodomicrobium]
MRAIDYLPKGEWPDQTGTDSLLLDFDARHRRRISLTTVAGAEILLDLPKAVAMADGGGLRLEDGSWLRVKAAPEPLLEVTAADAARLARVAWHLGNRHLPAEITGGAIRIRPDHVIEAMLMQLGAAVAHIEAPFQPEGGAYGGQGQTASHSHGHSHGHHHHHGDHEH